jgi:hypothetical protein
VPSTVQGYHTPLHRVTVDEFKMTTICAISCFQRTVLLLETIEAAHPSQKPHRGGTKDAKATAKFSEAADALAR